MKNLFACAAAFLFCASSAWAQFGYAPSTRYEYDYSSRAGRYNPGFNNGLYGDYGYGRSLTRYNPAWPGIDRQPWATGCRSGLCSSQCGSGSYGVCGCEAGRCGIGYGSCRDCDCRTDRYGVNRYGFDRDLNTVWGDDGCINGRCTIPHRSNYGAINPSGCVDGRCPLPSTGSIGGYDRRGYNANRYAPTAPQPRPDFYRGVSGTVRGLTGSSRSTARRINWQTDVRTAVREAETRRRPMLVTVTAAWCKACDRMKTETLNNDRIVRHVNDCFVAVRIDADDSRDLVQRLGIQSLPASVIVAPDMKIVRRVQGFQNVDQMRQILTAACPTHLNNRPIGASRPEPVEQAAVEQFRVASLND